VRVVSCDGELASAVAAIPTLQPRG